MYSKSEREEIWNNSTTEQRLLLGAKAKLEAAKQRDRKFAENNLGELLHDYKLEYLYGHHDF